MFMFDVPLRNELNNLATLPSKKAVQAETALFKVLANELESFKILAKNTLSVVTSLKETFKTNTLSQPSINWQLFPKSSNTIDTSKATPKV